MLGVATLPILVSDSSDETSTEDNPDTPDTPDTEVSDNWEDDRVQISVDGQDPQLFDVEAVSRVAQDGQNIDQVIETNIHDDVTQSVDAGDGTDVIKIGVGDDVDTLSDSTETADDVEGEGGDHVSLTVTAEALEGLPVPGSFGTVPAIEAEAESFLQMGSGDSLEINFEDGTGGHLEVVELETDYGNWGNTLPPSQVSSQVVFYVPEGESLEGLLDENSPDDYGYAFYWKPGLTAEDFGGIRLIGTVDLGESHDGGENANTGETVAAYDDTRPPPTITSNLPIVFTTL